MSKINISLQQMGLEQGSCRHTVRYIRHASARGILCPQSSGISVTQAVGKCNYLN